MISEPQMKQAAEALTRGVVVAAATESFFGLLADPFNRDALETVFRLKGRAAARASALMAPDSATWSGLVSQCPPLARAFAERFWPGPLTIVLPAAPHLPSAVVMDGRVGVRIPGASPAASLTALFGGPLTATSANLAGEPPCTQPEEVRQLFRAEIAQGALLVIDEAAPGATVSTLVAVSETGYEVIRAGAISAAQLEQSVRQQN